METPFDIRIPSDRVALAEKLPKIDNRQFNISKQNFIKCLAALAEYLGNPDWMLYQWGAFLPIPCGGISLQLDLKTAIELGVQLNAISKYRNFDRHLAGFFNSTQFPDSMFETRVAYLFSSLPTVSDLVFSPEHIVRGKLKRPEFDATTKKGVVSVECKRPHTHLQKAVVFFQSFVNAVKSVMKDVNWPSDLRLEIEVIKPFKEQVDILATRIVEQALGGKKPEKVFEFPAESVSCYVLPRESPFILKQKGTLLIDVMVLDKSEATGLFNPRFTSLRVVNRNLDNRFSRSTGSLVRNALKQLPSHQPGFIFLSELPFKIAENVSQRRLRDPVYSNVMAFGIWDTSKFQLVFRDKDSDYMHEIFVHSNQWSVAT